jgi:hypothetical protein
MVAGIAIGSAVLAAQWPDTPDPNVPRTADGKIKYDAPTPRTPDGHPDLSGVWMQAESGPPRDDRGRGQAGQNTTKPAKGEPNAATKTTDGPDSAFQERPGDVSTDVVSARFPFDPKGPPVATFWDAGANMEGGLPFTQWAKDLKKARMDIQMRDQPDANCLPIGFLQFHGQPQARKIMNIAGPSKMILVEWEANNGLWHIYMDGRKLPPQGEPQSWWYGYSVGHWEGDDLVVETNNLRGAEDSPYDGWLDIIGSPYSREATFVHRIRRPTFGHLQIDMTLTDPKAYTRPWTVRVDQRLTPDQELIEFICNENQQFRRRIKID